jgi:hypothetical protein
MQPRTVSVTGMTDSFFSGSAATPSVAMPTPPTITFPKIQTYGQLFEALLRGWAILPVGLYRRLQPGVVPAPPVVRDPIAHFIASNTGANASPFKNEKGLVSFVFTNPPADVILNHHDLVYVIKMGDDERGAMGGDDYY